MEVDIAINNECVFKTILDTCNIHKKYGSKELSATQKSTLQRCSQERNDGFYDTSCTDFDKWIYHTDCYSAYTSKEKIARYLKKRKKEGESSNTLCSPTGKRLRRYNILTFYFLFLTYSNVTMSQSVFKFELAGYILCVSYAFHSFLYLQLDPNI